MLIRQHIKEAEQQLPESPAVQIQDRLSVRIREIDADHLVTLPIRQLRDELDQGEGHLMQGLLARALDAPTQ